MKKRVALALLSLLACTFLLTGCGGEEGGISLGSTWKESEPKTYVYTLTHTPGTTTCGYEFHLTEGTYTTTLTPDNTDGKTYIYETVLTVTGTYTKGEEEIAFTDVTTTRTKTYGINSYSLFPKESERTISQHSVYPGENNSGFTVREHNYKVVSSYDYGKKEAFVTFRAKNSETGEYDLPVSGIPENRTYTKLPTGTFFDNDALMFVFRAFELTPAFSTTFTTIDTVNAKKVNIYLSADNEITQRDYTIAGVSTPLDVIKLTARMDAGASSGQPFTMYYAPLEGQEERNVLTELTTTLPYGMGSLTYSLITM
ncbi:MAG: hypothetical protein E7363_03630 [Clostridiales bacterium]|nr:hypothetical protein [Clostridiales bacterium]